LGGLLNRKIAQMLLTQEEIDALEECIDTRSDEGFETDVARLALDKIKAAQQGVHPTLLNVRRKLVLCPQCGCVYGVDLPAPQSG